MKKAKFQDNYKMVAGSCLGHFDEQCRQCSVCKINEQCKCKTLQHWYPKNSKEVVKAINKIMQNK